MIKPIKLFTTEGHHTRCWKCRRKGSYTVEASILFPIMLLLIAMVLNRSLELYQQSEKLAENTDTVAEVNMLQLFCASSELEDIISIFTEQ